jgi:TraY domain
MIRDAVKRKGGYLVQEGVSRPREEKRMGVGFRITPSLRKMLENAASKNGRSLSQEMEFRLEMTFRSDGVVREALTLAYGEDVAGDMFNVADTARTMRTIADMKEKGMLTATNEKLILSACAKTLTDMIEKMRSKVEGR